MITTLIAFAIALVSGPAMDSDPVPTYCAPIVWESSTQGEWDALLAQGWKGQAGDHMEALYAPGC